MEFIVVYDHPSDFPDSFVARWWSSHGIPTERFVVGDTLDHLCGYIHPTELEGRVWVPRHPLDDPIILGCWI